MNKIKLTGIAALVAGVATLGGCTSTGSASPYFFIGGGIPMEHRGVIGEDVDPNAAGQYNPERTGVYQHGVNAGQRTGPQYDPLRAQR